MSEPVANSQIEDVLSSIRRLVAEEIGQNPVLSRSRPEPEPQKLVLSPTQKIRNEAAETGEDLWQETEALVPKQPEVQWWMRSELDQVIPRTAKKPDEVTPVEELADDPVAEAQPEPAPVVKTPMPLRIKPKGRLEGALADLEAALSRQDTEFEPPEGEDQYNGGLEMTSMPWSEEPLNFAEDDDVAVEEAEEASAEAEEAEAASPEPEAEVVEAAAPVVDTEETPEAFEEEADEPIASNEFDAEFSGEAAEESDEAPFSYDPQERLFELAAEAATFRHHEAEEDFAEDEEILEDAEPNYDSPRLAQMEIDPADLIDEEALRQLVADIVRQELQGTLGERITRNVRKLVRREIHRALVSFETGEQ